MMFVALSDFKEAVIEGDVVKESIMAGQCRWAW
jgi:hypothetical protein